MRLLFCVFIFFILVPVVIADSHDMMKQICDEPPEDMRQSLYYYDGPFHLMGSSVTKDKRNTKKIWISFNGMLTDCTDLCYKLTHQAKAISIDIVARIVGTEGSSCGLWDTSTAIQKTLYLLTSQDIENLTLRSNIEDRHHATTVEHRYSF